MTVSYSAKCSTASKAGAFLKLLLLWKGSVYKLIWLEICVYLVAYFSISLLYRFNLDSTQRATFEQISVFCNLHGSLIPLTFVLAFYVSHVVSRWWAQWEAMPWPDSLAFKVNSYCQGKDEHSRILRRHVTRYAVLAIVETLRLVSSKVKKRFPTYEHLVEAGLMTESEMLAFRRVQDSSNFLKCVYWIPLTWASTITTHAYEQGYVEKAKFAVDINDQLNLLRSKCATILTYDSVSLPLVYTQIVTLAVYVFFSCTLLGRQWLDPTKQIPGYSGFGYDYVFPFFTVLQFLFFVGWLKVAEALLNPFGEDDEDFDTNYLIDRHLQLSYMMVDDIGQYPPHMEKDPYWEVGIPTELPYTVASLPFRGRRNDMAAEEVTVPLEKQTPIYTSSLNVNNKESSSNNGISSSFLRLNHLVTGMVRRVSASSQMASAETDPVSVLNAVKNERSKSTACAPSSQGFFLENLRRNSSCRSERLKRGISPMFPRLRRRSSEVWASSILSTASRSSSKQSLKSGTNGNNGSRKTSCEAVSNLTPVREEQEGSCLKLRSDHVEDLTNWGNEEIVIKITEDQS